MSKKFPETPLRPGYYGHPKSNFIIEVEHVYKKYNKLYWAVRARIIDKEWSGTLRALEYGRLAKIPRLHRLQRYNPDLKAFYREE